MKNNDLFLEPNFTTPVYKTKIQNSNIINADLIEKILNWKNIDSGLHRSNVNNSWHSLDHMNFMPEYRELYNIIKKVMNVISENEQYCDKYDLQCSNMWANVNQKNSYNKVHIHPGALWSGVYFVKTPNNCGRLKIFDPRIQSHIIEPVFKNNNVPKNNLNEIYYTAEEGVLLFFPGWLLHEVEPNLSDDLRISVSFNFKQVLNVF
jgi:uncharacterized protein (TIGR02466 family)